MVCLFGTMQTILSKWRNNTPLAVPEACVVDLNKQKGTKVYSASLVGSMMSQSEKLMLLYKCKRQSDPEIVNHVRCNNETMVARQSMAGKAASWAVIKCIFSQYLSLSGSPYFLPSSAGCCWWRGKGLLLTHKSTREGHWHSERKNSRQFTISRCRKGPKKGMSVVP